MGYVPIGWNYINVIKLIQQYHKDFINPVSEENLEQLISGVIHETVSDFSIGENKYTESDVKAVAKKVYNSKVEPASSIEDKSAGVWVKELRQIQNELVADMPTGEIKAWDIITVVSEHSRKLIKLIEKYESKQASSISEEDVRKEAERYSGAFEEKGVAKASFVNGANYVLSKIKSGISEEDKKE